MDALLAVLVRSAANGQVTLLCHVSEVTRFQRFLEKQSNHIFLPAFFLFVCFCHLASPRHMEFPGQEADPSRSCDLPMLPVQQRRIL